MAYDIKITKSTQSGVEFVDFHDIPFGRLFSDHMFVADYVNGEWKNLEIRPYGEISFNPAMLALHYGQAIFEGMKATLDKQGRPLLFRPEKHANRINVSAKRMCMPAIPNDLFLQALSQLVSIDKDWIPPVEGSALYIRPFMFATDEMIGVKVSKTYKFIIFTGPVGPYYPKPVKLLVEKEFVRAVKGGVGEAKAAGNYGASLLPAQRAQEQGYDQVLWMDGHEFKYVQEVGTMNLFFVIGNTVLTPETDGAILRGITRDSIITILRDKGIPVEVRKISIDEVEEAYSQGELKEVFGAGTAAVIANVSEIKNGDKIMKLPPISEHRIAQMLKTEINGIRSGTKEDKFNWLAPVEADVLVMG